MSNKKQFQALSAPKGVPDYFPPQSSAFYKVRQTMVEQAHLSGFQHIELPIFEDTALFARGVASPPMWCQKRCTPLLIAATAP